MKTRIKQLIIEYQFKIEREKMRRETAVALSLPTFIIDSKVARYNEFINSLNELLK